MMKLLLQISLVIGNALLILLTVVYLVIPVVQGDFRLGADVAAGLWPGVTAALIFHSIATPPPKKLIRPVAIAMATVCVAIGIIGVVNSLVSPPTPFIGIYLEHILSGLLLYGPGAYLLLYAVDRAST